MLCTLVDIGRFDRHEITAGTDETTGLLIPAVGRPRAPERPTPQIVDRPSQRRVVRITRVIVARIELEPVAIWISEVDEEGV